MSEDDGRYLSRFLADGAERVALVTVSAGGRREARRLLPDGTEERVERAFPPRVDELARVLQRMIDADPQALEQLRASGWCLIPDVLTAGLSRVRARGGYDGSAAG